MYSYTDKDLYQELLDLELIPKKVLDNLYKNSQKSKDDLATLILQEGLVPDQNLGQIISNLINLPLIDLSETNILDENLNFLTEDFARYNQVIIFDQNKEEIKVATAHPEDIIVIDALSKKTNKKIKLHYATKKNVSEALLLYHKDAGAMFTNIIEENVANAKSNAKVEPPIIKIVDTIIGYADQKKASDIHIEPLEDISLIRFRIDGMMTDIVRLPEEIHPRIVTRIKVLSNLRTDEHQAAQDGKIQWSAPENSNFSTQKLDLRVSIVPSTDGEKIVMRLLSESSRQLSLEDLGLSSADLEKVQHAYKKPHGMILATGPTGSGKTTTMYTILKLLNSREVNISTIEDPVEYDIEGITQIQVNKKTELTFAKGLRSIVRQDPDIILVGEIRDEETAEIAVNAAMTGHLVLSTLHTNDSTTTMPRLTDMGIEPFLISSTINVVIAQRLVRKIHLKCRGSEEIDTSSLSNSFDKDFISNAFGDKKTIRVYKGQGCDICNGTGYEGRVGIYEVLTIDDDIRQAIVEKKDASTIRDIAIKNGMNTMAQDGLEKVKQGVTTIEEIIRVTQEFD
ncbi:MAG: GspE/PulE family protein [Candidatus Pacebacteria bacterium]|nr:GspE/PulE family protein [Candidatus Paceibacterota bacterium]